ncbi:hemocyte protein-glutamine gamma-glutamyltransferase [Procambarus clarkii]|uniref:hemocyte protein-glutamine gamma-glutamyltransferase n=1 Tax=Procambarus clarkii TaxID=6728 RepID=UPI001E675D60|nr:hemocyte protein-glutamine gamma-glutamyltransferase-like [Procambarus clarkii]XP_045617265.1 hemocyte protein-glutamine gamma-glutamyltransferase-like [Procambarus clarkii]XP_045617266.1 hemocyte protein-glutamine gamma-glutamyltransferase-like [Procambarus clarkii]
MAATATGYNNWLNSLRTDYARTIERRRLDEAEAEKPPTSANKVDRLHWYIKDNAKTHKTIKFDLVHDQKAAKPVLRRGQAFYLAIRFHNDFDVTKDRVILNFKFGHKPAVQKGTMAVIVVENDKFTKTKSDWDCRIDPGSRGKDLVLQVYIPAAAMVGIWHLDIRSGLQDLSQGRAMNLYSDDTDCFVLFNPWCKDDAVYLDDETKREEYVINDKGKVYVGAYKKSRGRPWAYGQFDDVVLPVAVYILELSRVADSERGNPVQVVRGVSAGVNDTDEEGILQGRWDGEYSDGVAPFKWTGSVRILEDFVKNGYKPVKYGQCWVFSAVVTTICRALGIPCRSVTNFVSAHDTNSSLTIDKFFNKEGKEIEGGPDQDNYDSIWNFHVWNDVWMARNDLPPGYGGWQAIDATPQEASDHKMQCGPVSLQAIRRGDIGLNYDAPFVFAEVNADVMHWGEDPNSNWGWSRMKMNQYHIGRQILTKCPGVEDDVGDKDQEDVLSDYKNEEGTEAERLAVHNAIRGSNRAQQYYDYKKDIKEDVFFDLIEIDKISIGDQFQVKVVIRNDSDSTRKVSAYLSAQSIYYTGVNVSLIKKAEGTFVLQPQESRDVALTVKYNEYWKKLVEQCMVKIYAICRVQETGQTWTEEDDFQIEKPKLQIETAEDVIVRKQCEATFSFTNPLDVPLTEGQLSVDGAGLMRPRVIKIENDVPAKGLFTHTINFLPRIHGERKIIASFNSKELFDIAGAKSVIVQKPPQ